jgi:hypothetical protein
MIRRRPKGPKYLREKRLKSGSLAYYWSPPTWAIAKGCALNPEPLGSNYVQAVERAAFLNKHFGEWRTGRKSSGGPDPYTLDWLFAEYRASRKLQRLKSRREVELSLTIIGTYQLSKDPSGRRLGQIEVRRISRSTAQKVYEALVVRPDGTLRATHLNRVMRHVRSAWNVVHALQGRRRTLPAFGRYGGPHWF